MKKTKKSLQPVELALFSESNPRANWNEFRNSNQGVDYKTTRLTAIHDQGGLCAYCEEDHLDKPENFSIEHFHPKSDRSNPAKNWALDWDNMHAVCRGGRDKNHDGEITYPTPENLSCDAYKDYLITKGNLVENCEGSLLNPLQMPIESLFKFDKSNGKLVVDGAVCERLCDIYSGPNSYTDLTKLAEETIQILNLNCQRLCDMRLEVLKSYNQIIKKAHQQNNTKIHEQLAQRWFSTPWPKYFTTRRALLGKAAESYLRSVNYDG